MAVVYPRAWIEVEGARLVCLSASVSRTAQRHSDTFAALLSITASAKSGFGLSRWTDDPPTGDVSIVMASSLGGGDERIMITGKIDEPNVALGKMEVSITGRDKSAALTEKRRNEKFLNQKPEDIAGKIAKDHGLSLDFKGNGAFSGKTNSENTANLVLNQSDFETISNLADQIGCRWYVDGSTLFIEPKDEGSSGYDVVWIPPVPGQPADANVLELSLRRNMSAARPHEFTVKSWHQRSRKLFKHTAKIDGQGDPLAYSDHHNGKTQQQVEDLAKSRVRDRIRHELGVSVRAPGDLTIDVRQTLNLSGTGTIYDQAYAIDHVTWDMEAGAEFTMVVDATAAKQGRDPEGAEGGGGAKPAASTGGASSPPLPPARPAGV